MNNLRHFPRDRHVLLIRGPVSIASQLARLLDGHFLRFRKIVVADQTAQFGVEAFKLFPVAAAQKRQQSVAAFDIDVCQPIGDRPRCRADIRNCHAGDRVDFRFDFLPTVVVAGAHIFFDCFGDFAAHPLGQSALFILVEHHGHTSRQPPNAAAGCRQSYAHGRASTGPDTHVYRGAHELVFHLRVATGERRQRIGFGIAVARQRALGRRVFAGLHQTPT